MKRVLLCTLALVVVAGVALGQMTGKPAEKPAGEMTHDTHAMVAPADLKWGSPPPVFEQNAQFALISGDPSKPGLFVVRLKMPAGYKIMPHWHPTDEHVTVLSGTFALGMGEKFDEATMKELPAGGYALLPADMRHYAMAKTEAVVQVHGTGPFALTYVNPNDDPSKRTQTGSK
jgi:quercetin dioxygenase-like cupin family protein